MDMRPTQVSAGIVVDVLKEPYTPVPESAFSTIIDMWRFSY